MPTAKPEKKRREVLYRGHVQGVGFRYTARSIAERYDVTGYVRNLPDGRVELIVEGAVGELDAMLKDIQSELGRHITDTNVQELPAVGGFDAFDIRLY